MAGQRCSSSAFQRFSVPAAAAAVRAWATSASQQFSVSAFERCCCPGVGACPASASQQFRVSEFQSLSFPAAAAGGAWLGSVAAVQRFRVSAFKLLQLLRLASVASPQQLQQFSVSAFKRSGCCGRGACLGSVSSRSSSEFQRLSVAVALLQCCPASAGSSSEFQSFSG